MTEDLSKDLAKILPFAAMGIFIVNVSFFETSESFDVLRHANDNRESILYYLGFSIVLEFALRILCPLVTEVKNAVRRHSRTFTLPPNNDRPGSKSLAESF